MGFDRLRQWRFAGLALLALAACGCASQKAEDGPARGSAQALLENAQRYLEQGGYNQSITLYSALEVRYPFSEENREGQLGLMYAYYKSGQPEASLETADKFIRENPRHPRVDYAYYMRGLAYYPRNLGPLERVFKVDPASRPQEDSRRAFDNFSLFLQRFPESEWAPDARQRMVYLRNVLAAHEIAVARYYMTRHAYIAALNRAKTVVEDYQGTDSVNDALTIMVKAYNKLDLPDLAADAERVLRENQ